MAASRQPDSEKDQYPPDTQFGRSASKDDDLVEEYVARGGSEESLPDTAAREPRAGAKARAEPDDTSDESFPASDPPSSTGSTAGH